MKSNVGFVRALYHRKRSVLYAALRWQWFVPPHCYTAAILASGFSAYLCQTKSELVVGYIPLFCLVLVIALTLYASFEIDVSSAFAFTMSLAPQSPVTGFAMCLMLDSKSVLVKIAGFLMLLGILLIFNCMYANIISVAPYDVFGMPKTVLPSDDWIKVYCTDSAKYSRHWKFSEKENLWLMRLNSEPQFNLNDPEVRFKMTITMNHEATEILEYMHYLEDYGCMRLSDGMVSIYAICAGSAKEIHIAYIVKYEMGHPLSQLDRFSYLLLTVYKGCETNKLIGGVHIVRDPAVLWELDRLADNPDKVECPRSLFG